jgi:hypothetical protein
LPTLRAITCSGTRESHWARLVAPIMLCVALVALPATGRAEVLDDVDAIGDMIVLDADPVPAPERALNDIRSTTLIHGDRRVVIAVDYVDLRKQAGGPGQHLEVTLVNDQGLRRHLDLVATGAQWMGHAQMYNGRYASIDCRVRHSIDYRRNVARMTFPRRCADSPRWLVFKIRSLAETREGTFTDDALRDRATTADDPGLRASDRVQAGCATRNEFDRAEPGLRMRRVHAVFDTRGSLFGEPDGAGLSRWYTQCRPDRGYSECRAVVDYRLDESGVARVVPGKTWAASCSR